MPILINNHDPNSLFHQMKIPKPVNQLDISCENTQPALMRPETTQSNPKTETIYVLRELLPRMSPTVLTSIDFKPEDQESEEWIDQLQAWTQRIHLLEKRIMTSQLNHKNKPSQSTESLKLPTSTISPTTSGPQLLNFNHQLNGVP